MKKFATILASLALFGMGIYGANAGKKLPACCTDKCSKACIECCEKGNCKKDCCKSDCCTDACSKECSSCCGK